MDPNNPVIHLCIKGTQAEFAGRLEDARALYRQAWDLAQTDEECCVAAHYAARFAESGEEKLRWNHIALERANASKSESVQSFYPSLYLNLGQSYERLGDLTEAQRYYDLAAGLGFVHSDFSSALPEA